MRMTEKELKALSESKAKKPQETMKASDFNERYEIDRSKKGLRAIPKTANGSKTQDRLRKTVTEALKPISADVFISDSVIKFTIPDVCSKPRMTQRDKWLKPPRTRVAKYWQFVQLVQCVLPLQIPKVFHSITLIAHIKMPNSWKQDKKDSMRGKRHHQKPDGDNILKAVCDSITKDDAGISDKHITKFWSDFSRIEVEIREF